MPTYSYACTECDNRFDIVQSFSEDSLTVCTGKLRKLFNSVGIVFKGSGFYRTDSRSGSSTVSESSGESKSDSAPVKTEATASKDSSSSSSAKPSTSTPTPAKAAASS